MLWGGIGGGRLGGGKSEKVFNILLGKLLSVLRLNSVLHD